MCYGRLFVSDSDVLCMQGSTARVQFATQFQSMAKLPGTESATSSAPVVPSGRLVTLLKQVVAYQIDLNRYHPKVAPHVPTLLEDFRCFTVPDALRTTVPTGATQTT